MGLGSASAASVSEGGPPNPSEWTLSFEDTFEGTSLDTSKWTIGYSWGDGRNAIDSEERIVDRNVIVDNGQLSLRGTHDGSEYLSGAIHTHDKAYFGPGSYWEAKIRMPRRIGFLPAFWAFPNDIDWPPEIDFVELFQTDGSDEELRTSSHFLHYTSSTVPDDESTHSTIPAEYDNGKDITESFVVYGCEWRTDRICHYVDGTKVAETTDSTVMESLNNGAPYHMLLAIMIDKVGTTDPSETWGETLDAEWVRVWEVGDNTSDSGETTETDTETEHYLYFGSAQGGTASYTFTTSGGNVSIDQYEEESGETGTWVSDDGMDGGGEISADSDGDGFYYTGEITDLQYDGDLAMYIDHERVDPNSFPSSSDTGSSTEELPNTLTIDGQSSSKTTYELSVSGDIQGTQTSADGDSVSDGTVVGSVTSDVDEYRFDGELESLSLDGDATISVNGTRVDLLQIWRSSSSTGSVPYIVETDGRLLKADVPTASFNSGDKVSDDSVFGTVLSGSDAYWVLSGSVTDVSSSGGGVVTELNGEVVNLTR